VTRANGRSNISEDQPNLCLSSRLGVLHRRGQFLQATAGEDFSEVGQEFLVDQAVAGEDLAAVEAEGRAVETGDGSASFLRKQRARCGVPGIQIELPETVVAAAGHIGQIERRRSCTPHAVRAQRDLGFL